MLPRLIWSLGEHSDDGRSHHAKFQWQVGGSSYDVSLELEDP